MRFDPAADPWGTAMLAAAALWLLALFVVIAAQLANTPRRLGGRMMLVSLLAFLGAAVAGTWIEIQRADAIAARPAPPPPVEIIAKVPVDDGLAEPESASGDTGPGESATSTAGEAAMGSTGPDATSTGNPEPGTTGAPEPGTTGDPEPGTTGDPEPGTTGDPEPETTGDPEPGTTGDPEPETTGDPEPTPLPATSGEPRIPVEPPQVTVPENIPRVDPLPPDPDQRDAAIRAIIEDAKRAAGGGQRCGNLQRVAEAWAQLRQVPVSRRAKSVTADLERCRRRLLYSISRRQLADHKEARDAFFDKLPSRFRKEHGLIVQASISGGAHNRLRIGNRELDAARADAILSSGLLDELAALEFANVVMSTGKKSKTYEIPVTPESELGLPWLRAVGLGEPLKLEE